MAKVIIFGNLDAASLAHFYLRHDSEQEVVAFTVHEQYLPDEHEFEGVPLVPFEEVDNIYSPTNVLQRQWIWSIRLWVCGSCRCSLNEWCGAMSERPHFK
ncbi:MAG: hypothetical protein AAF702_29335 [Chloroflexota bacterium]